MRREDIKIGQKVVPHSKSKGSHFDSSCWRKVKENKDPYLYVIRIDGNTIVLDDKRDAELGDYFLPEDFELYIENNRQNNNESRNINMKKSELNSSMLFKMRDGNLCVLLETINDKVFYKRQEIIDGSYSGQISLNDYDDNVLIIGDQYESDLEYEIVAIKQCQSCTEALRLVVISTEPEEWDWVEETETEKDVEEQKVENTVQNITINITIDSSNKDSSQFRELINGLSKYATQYSKV